MRRMIVLVVMLALGLLALAPSAVAGDNFVATLSGDQEVPPRDTQAVGVATFKLRDDGTALAFKVNVANLDNVFAAHIHCGDPGVNGPVVQLLFAGPTAGGRTQGVLSAGTFDPDGLTCTFGTTTVPLIDAMRAELTYTNVHTNDGDATPNEGAGDFPGGEIRGQNLVRGAGG